MASPEMQQLKDMYAGGMLDMAEFLRMSKDLQQLGGTSASQREQPEDEQPEEELLVDEHGDVLGSSAPASPTRNATRQSIMDELLSNPATACTVAHRPKAARPRDQAAPPRLPQPMDPQSGAEGASFGAPITSAR